MKLKFQLSILAAVSAALMPLAVASQVAPDRSARAERGEAPAKWEVFGGYGYTSLNQVNGARYGLEGVNLSITRDWGKYFGLTADGAFYTNPIACCDYGYEAGSEIADGHPKVNSILAGPVFHANFYGHFDVFVHALLGGEHTGGESMSPSTSLAGGAGGGVEYKLTQRFSLRASGDDIAASFSLAGNSPALNYSPHITRNARAAFGVVYKF